VLDDRAKEYQNLTGTSFFSGFMDLFIDAFLPDMYLTIIC